MVGKILVFFINYKLDTCYENKPCLYFLYYANLSTAVPWELWCGETLTAPALPYGDINSYGYGISIGSFTVNVFSEAQAMAFGSV